MTKLNHASKRFDEYSKSTPLLFIFSQSTNLNVKSCFKIFEGFHSCYLFVLNTISRFTFILPVSYDAWCQKSASVVCKI